MLGGSTWVDCASDILVASSGVFSLLLDRLLLFLVEPPSGFFEFGQRCLNYPIILSHFFEFGQLRCNFSHWITRGGLGLSDGS